MPGVAELEARFQQRQIDLAPLREGWPVNGDRPALAVIGRISIVKIVLQPVHGRHQFLARPTLAALIGPAVVVLQHGAVRDHVVDGRASAKAATAIVTSRLLNARAPRRQEWPLVVGVHLRIVDAERVGAVHDGRRLGSAIVGSGLQ